MTIPKVKYQIVVSKGGSAKTIISTHATLEDAQEVYRTAQVVMKLGSNNMIMRNPDWNELELQRVEVLEG